MMPVLCGAARWTVNAIFWTKFLLFQCPFLSNLLSISSSHSFSFWSMFGPEGPMRFGTGSDNGCMVLVDDPKDAVDRVECNADSERHVSPNAPAVLMLKGHLYLLPLQTSHIHIINHWEGRWTQNSIFGRVNSNVNGSTSDWCEWPPFCRKAGTRCQYERERHTREPRYRNTGYRRSMTAN